MASIHKELVVNAPAEYTWEALKDFAAVHVRLFPRILVSAVADGDARIVTFANGLVAREKLIDVDGERRRLAYSASGGQLTYHHASMQVFDAGENCSRFVWILDIQPDDVKDGIQELVNRGIEIMQEHVAETFRETTASRANC